MIEVNLILICL